MLQAPPALLVAPSAVEESIANEIADKPSPETRRSYDHVWRYYRAWLDVRQLDPTAVRPKHIQLYLAHLRAKRARSRVRESITTPRHQWIQDEADVEKLLNVPATTWTQRRDRLIVRMTFGLGLLAQRGATP